MKIFKSGKVIQNVLFFDKILEFIKIKDVYFLISN